MRKPLALLLAMAAVLLVQAAASADGFILPERPEHSLSRSYRVDHHEVKIAIRDGVAEVHVDQAFTNVLDRPLEVTYLFPVPEGAVIDRFALVVDGEEMPARLYDRDEARRIYEEIVRRRRDPALLEYAGRGLFRTSVFPVPARGSRRVKLRYHQAVEALGDLRRFTYPLATEKYSARPLERLTVEIEVSSSRKINNFYAPTHPVRIISRTDRELAARYAEQAVLPRADLTFYYQLGGAGDFDATILTYRPNPAEDGYFLFLASPRAELSRGAVQPKTIFFVLDRSGSMNGEKLKQAKEALRTILPNLGSRDRFNLIAYNDRVETFRDAPVAAERYEVEAALTYVERLTALGGTDINGALEVALRQLPGEADRGRYVVFLTDGQPTAGETNPETIRANVRAANKSGQARLFVFGVGYDVHTVLLDALAAENRGSAGYVRPGEDLEAAVAGLYRQIQYPVLTDLTLSAKGVTLTDCYPRQLPDLFHGQQLLMAGRYRGAGRVSLTLSGMADGERRNYDYQVEFPAGEDRLGQSFVARFWAARRIGYLLDQLRLVDAEAARREIIDEIIRLARDYGIATEYTSFLVQEDQEVSARRLEEIAAAPAAGADAVTRASANKALQNAPQLGEADWTAGRAATVGDKTFYLRDGVWVDAAYRAGMEAIKVPAFSDAYFALARRLGDRSIYLSVGDRLVLIWEGKAYRVEP